MPFSHPSPAAAVRGRLARAPRRRAVAGLAAAGLAALLLGGCTSAPDQPPSPTPTASAAEPIFASDEEALAAAVEAYERYLAVIDDVGNAGGQGVERLQEVASHAYARELVASFQRLQKQDLHTEGHTTFDTVKLAEASTGDGAVSVSVYLCYDVGAVRVLNAQDQDVTPVDRPARTPVQVNFEPGFEHPGRLVVKGSESWRGEDFC